MFMKKGCKIAVATIVGILDLTVATIVEILDLTWLVLFGTFIGGSSWAAFILQSTILYLFLV